MHLIGPSGSNVRGDLSQGPHSEAPMSSAMAPVGGLENIFLVGLRRKVSGSL